MEWGYKAMLLGVGVGTLFGIYSICNFIYNDSILKVRTDRVYSTLVTADLDHDGTTTVQDLVRDCESRLGQVGDSCQKITLQIPGIYGQLQNLVIDPKLIKKPELSDKVTQLSIQQGAVPQTKGYGAGSVKDGQ